MLGIYCLLIINGAAPKDRGLSIPIIGGISMAMQVGMNVIVGLFLLIIGKKEVAKSLLISAAFSRLWDSLPG